MAITDTRTITVITEDGEAHSFSVPKGVATTLAPPIGYSLFGDAEGNPMQADSDRNNKDVTVYLLPVKE